MSVHAPRQRADADRSPLAQVAPQLWRNLPLLVGTGLLAMLGGLLTLGAVLSGGGIVLAPALAALTIAPAWFAACALADPLLDGRVVSAAQIRDAFLAGFRTAPRVALPALEPAQLAAFAVLAIDATPDGAPLLTLSLAADLIALGCALIVAPFALATAAGAFGSRADAPLGAGEGSAIVLPVASVRDAWRIGAGVAATLPLLALGGIAVVALAVVLVRALGPVLLVVVPGPAALVVVACGREQLARVAATSPAAARTTRGATR